MGFKGEKSPQITQIIKSVNSGANQEVSANHIGMFPNFLLGSYP